MRYTFSLGRQYETAIYTTTRYDAMPFSYILLLPLLLLFLLRLPTVLLLLVLLPLTFSEFPSTPQFPM